MSFSFLGRCIAVKSMCRVTVMRLLRLRAVQLSHKTLYLK